MRIQMLMLSVLLAFIPMVALAGANHDHGHDHGHSHSHDPVNQEQAQAAALKQVARLVKKGKIDNSWTNAKVATAEKKKFGGKLEWVVTFSNEKVKDPGKQTLYIFLSLSGEYIAANYSGK